MAIICYIPVVAEEVTSGADFLSGVADIHARNIAVHCSEAVEEDEEADEGWDHKLSGFSSLIPAPLLEDRKKNKE